MNTTVGAACVLAAALRLSLAQAPSVLTVAQRDEWRSSMDEPSAAVSADGQYVAFTSYAQLVPADTNRRRDIYVLDRADGRVTLESVAPDGTAAPFDSAHPGLSSDGRLLVYETSSIGSGRSVVVLRNRFERSATIIGGDPANASTGGGSATPVISGDGRFVAFVATDDTVHGRDANEARENVYVFEVRTGTVGCASLDSEGRQPSSGFSVAPSVSGDGRYVAFTSNAPLDPAIGRNGGAGSRGRLLSHVYVRDMRLNTTRLLSVGAGRQPDGGSWDPAVSGNGRYVAFVSAAATLAAGDRNRSADVFVADLQTGLIELVSRSAKGGSGNGPSERPSLSADGRFVAFQSEASDLVCAKECSPAAEDINLLSDVFLFDRETGVMTRVSADAAGGWMEASSGASVDAAGEVVAFSSRHPIDAADRKNDFDLFVRAGSRHRSAHR